MRTRIAESLASTEDGSGKTDGYGTGPTSSSSSDSPASGLDLGTSFDADGEDHRKGHTAPGETRPCDSSGSWKRTAMPKLMEDNETKGSCSQGLGAETSQLQEARRSPIRPVRLERLGQHCFSGRDSAAAAGSSIACRQHREAPGEADRDEDCSGIAASRREGPWQGDDVSMSMGDLGKDLGKKLNDFWKDLPEEKKAEMITAMQFAVSPLQR